MIVLKNIIQRILTVLLIAASCGIAYAQESSITNTAVTLIDSGSVSHEVSVYPGKARYSGSHASGTFGDGTVMDYRFFSNASSNMGYAAGAEGRISAITYATGNDYNTDIPDVWTSNDPDSAPANFTNATTSGRNDVAGTIDVNRVVNGTVYVLCGGFSYGVNAFRVDVTMTGDGQPPLMSNISQIPAQSRNTYAVVFEFQNEAQRYDRISFSYDHDAGNRSRFMGIVLDGEGPPQGTVIILK